VTLARPPGHALRAYLLATRVLPLLAPRHLQKRLVRGKEMPGRWREKLGEAGLPRPAGRLIWLHAVGLGEVLALRGLIAEMGRQAQLTEFLVTSTTRASAEVFGANLPPRTRHQFLPLDAPEYLERFLDHWRPDLSIWAEQDLWPGAVMATARRGIPLALINARMNGAAFARRKRWRGLYADLFARFALIAAQDQASATHLSALGAAGVRVLGSLKSAAPPLAADPQALEKARKALAGRRAILLASSHAEDEAVVLDAFRKLPKAGTRPVLLIAPRDLHRAEDVQQASLARGLSVRLRSQGVGPEGADVWIVDTFGEMGLWYRLCPVTVIGGSFGPAEGHNPWEPAALGSAILHGPRTASFAADFAALDGAGAALPVSAETLASALLGDHGAMVAKATAMARAGQGALGPLAAELLSLGGAA
jgi:3-deoxy-D-manno-octulosonic-acid transferase